MSGTYFKLAAWDERLCVFKDGKGAFASEDEARGEAEKSGGQFRISRVTSEGRVDGEPFDLPRAARAARSGRSPAKSGPSVTSLVYGRRLPSARR
ncbi:MAG TPA: hypothetical protein VGR35_11800 [Tepidisphaeraceae bacterium]|nr:hypothetical protein [Tepidisphaeraceae bacterium]